jgi:hypothetical protein
LLLSIDADITELNVGGVVLPIEGDDMGGPPKEEVERFIILLQQFSMDCLVLQYHILMKFKFLFSCITGFSSLYIFSIQ